MHRLKTLLVVWAGAFTVLCLIFLAVPEKYRLWIFFLSGLMALVALVIGAFEKKFACPEGHVPTFPVPLPPGVTIKRRMCITCGTEFIVGEENDEKKKSHKKPDLRVASSQRKAF